MTAPIQTAPAAPIPTSIAPTATATATPTPTPTSLAPVTALPYSKAPPPITLPPVPAGVVTVPPAQLRGQLPRKQELELMPAVESEIDRFVDFASVFGKTAPSQAAVEQTLTSAFQWSMLHVQLSAWQKYAQSQEVAAWVNARSVINRLAPAFALAVKTDSSIGVELPLAGEPVRRAFLDRQACRRRAEGQRGRDGFGPPCVQGGGGQAAQEGGCEGSACGAAGSTTGDGDSCNGSARGLDATGGRSSGGRHGCPAGCGPFCARGSYAARRSEPHDRRPRVAPQPSRYSARPVSLRGRRGRTSTNLISG